MRRNAKAIIIVAVLSIPVMALFQNCGKTIAMTDIDPISKASSIVNTNDLPMGDSQVDQISSDGEVISSGGEGSSGGVPTSDESSVSVSSGDSTVTTGLPSEEEQEDQEIQDSLAACAAIENSTNSNNVNGAGVFSADGKSASNIRGKHTISSADFNGNTQIDSISNSYGSLTVCGLDIGTLSNYNGKITLVNNSKIGVINSLNGQLVVIDGSGAKLRNSKVQIKKVN